MRSPLEREGPCAQFTPSPVAFSYFQGVGAQSAGPAVGAPRASGAHPLSWVPPPGSLVHKLLFLTALWSQLARHRAVRLSVHLQVALPQAQAGMSCQGRPSLRSQAPHP